MFVIEGIEVMQLSSQIITTIVGRTLRNRRISTLRG